ncbi:MAG: hypothetical protein PHR35_03780, partial [Kiritimatiellae bacterium]|nr:hypothetical protein [Kiritimatiellia bacterium]
WTAIDWDCPAHAHLLTHLTPADRGARAARRARRLHAESLMSGQPLERIAAIRLSEPNALLLDRARCRWNDEPWQERQELRSIEDALHRRFALQVRRGYCAQPWCDTAAAPPLGTLTLEFDLNLDVPLAGCELAVEQPAIWQARLDGESLPMDDAGWWVDEAIRKVRLPPLAAGAHRLVMTVLFNRRTELEWFYLLGDFGVALNGWESRLTAPPRLLGWGDWTAQGLPFYTGNVTYECEFESAGGELVLCAPPAPAPLLAVALDGRDVGRVAFAPYSLELGRVPAGEHSLAITAFGHRRNAFEATCLPDGSGYALKPMGLLRAPEIDGAEDLLPY